MGCDGLGYLSWVGVTSTFDPPESFGKSQNTTTAMIARIRMMTRDQRIIFFPVLRF